MWKTLYVGQHCTAKKQKNKKKSVCALDLTQGLPVHNI